MNRGPEPPRGAEEFAAALRAAIQDRGLSLDRLRHHLSEQGHELSIATLSYWQSGRSRPERATSLVALEALEALLGVPRGHLADRLPPRRRAPIKGGDGTGDYSASSVTTDGDVIDRMVKELGFQWDQGLRSISVHDRIEVRSDRVAKSHLVRQVIRATADDLDRFALWYQHDDPCSYPYFTTSLNCRLGKVLEDPERLLVVAEIILDRALKKGEFMIIEYRLEAAGQVEPLQHWYRALLAQVKELHLEVKFHPEAIPVAAERYVVIDGAERVEPILITGDTLQLLTLDFGPGVSGIRWQW